MAKLVLREDFIKLGQALKAAKLVGSGVEAKIVILVTILNQHCGTVDTGKHLLFIRNDEGTYIYLILPVNYNVY